MLFFGRPLLPSQADPQVTRTTFRQPSSSAAVDPRSEDFVRLLGDHLIECGLLDEMGRARAARARSNAGERFDHVLSRLGLVNDGALTRAMARILDLPLADQGALAAVDELPTDIEQSFWRKQAILPLSDDGTVLHIAVGDPFNLGVIEALSFQVDRRVVRYLAPRREIELALDRLLARPSVESGVVLVDERPSTAEDVAGDAQRLRDLAAETPIIGLVQSLVVRAVEARASDIHIEPGESSVQVRFRVDGVLHLIMQLPLHVRAAVASRIKVMARLDIAEQRLPQDGRCQTSVSGHTIDLRVSTMPTANGESVVMRILDREQLGSKLTDLGFAADVSDELGRLLSQPTGIVLVTGPTGSGKTTTLYSGLTKLDTKAQKVVTVEDPIEYRLPGVMQIQVQPRIGLTFATALRSILRQDPDVIMVGEIRDLETAQMAIQAALTGHLVLSTVHTNSAAATITRLIDMGLEHYLLASTIAGVVAQRLLRKLCVECATHDDLGSGVVERLGWSAHVGSEPLFRRRVGCPNCRNTGYSGRIAIGEVMAIGPDLRTAIAGRASEHEIQAVAVRGGMRTLAQDGLLHASAGITTIEEVLRVTRME